MEFTRVDTKKLKAAIEKAVSHIDQAKAALQPYLANMTDEQRGTLAHPRASFPTAGRALARAALEHPEVAAVSDFEAEAVVEDLDNSEALAPMLEKLSDLNRLVSDTRLLWLSEAWVPSLALYAVAKVKAKTNGAIRTVVDPLADVFATVRRSPKKPE
ncbi:MAG: hypothetical protein U0441_05230 [Polyangiaceae bacterium]